MAIDRQTDSIDFSRLTVDERTLLAHQLWESVQRETETSQLSGDQLAELNRRLDDAEAGRGRSTPWKIVQARLFKRHPT